MPARAESLAAVHALLARFWAAADETLAPPPSEEWRSLFATAVAEIAANVVRHAYPTDHGTMQLAVWADAEQVVACFTDRGVAFVMSDPSQPAPAAAPPDLPDAPGDILGVPEGGYGLSIARAAVDELLYSREPDGTNHWRLVKRLAPIALDRSAADRP